MTDVSHGVQLFDGVNHRKIQINVVWYFLTEKNQCSLIFFGNLKQAKTNDWLIVKFQQTIQKTNGSWLDKNQSIVRRCALQLEDACRVFLFVPKLRSMENQKSTLEKLTLDQSIFH